jgi:dihydropteroate synthase
MHASPASPPIWRTARLQVRLHRPVIAGVVNVTPDSFWDGGRHASVDAAVRHAEQLLAEGADILDVGGESSRPGAVAVTATEEEARVLPVIEQLARRWPEVAISVDTMKAAVARAALDAGAVIINDVSALRADPALGAVVAEAGAGLVLMHSRGSLENMALYELAEYGENPIADVAAELSLAVERARHAGVHAGCLVVDPGLGFAKRTEHSLALLRDLRQLASLGLPVLVGPSRKRFIGDAVGGLPAEQRLEGGIAACVVALQNGALLFRMHDVAPARRALDLAFAVITGGSLVAHPSLV